MPEEEARQENAQQQPQPNEDSESPKTLKNRVGQFLASGLSFKSSKEKETMTNEETRPEGTQQQPSDTPEPERQMFSEEEKSAIDEFEEIKQALIGDDPEWLIPRVNPKALASEP